MGFIMDKIIMLASFLVLATVILCGEDKNLITVVAGPSNLESSSYTEPSQTHCWTYSGQQYCTTTGGGPAAGPDYITQMVADLTAGTAYKLTCVGRFRWSKCTTLITGDEYQAEITGRTMKVFNVRVGGNQGRLMKEAKYKILDIRPLVKEVR